MDPADLELVPPTGVGRSFSSSAIVRLGDASPGGRLRFDALARVLQDVSDDDARDAGFGDLTWVVRRTVIRVERFPVYLDQLSLSTWCAGFGAAWAERRISVKVDSQTVIEAASLWVHVDRDALIPSRVPREFSEVFAPSAQGRRVRSHLLLAAPDPGGSGDRHTQSWPLRFGDFDVLGHVNNAAYWLPLEELLASRRSLRDPMVAVMEHGEPINRDDTVVLHAVDTAGGVDAWLMAPDGRALATMRVQSLRSRQ